RPRRPRALPAASAPAPRSGLDSGASSGHSYGCSSGPPPLRGWLVGNHHRRRDGPDGQSLGSSNLVLSVSALPRGEQSFEPRGSALPVELSPHEVPPVPGQPLP